MNIDKKSEGFKLGYTTSVIKLKKILDKHENSKDADIQFYCKEIREGYYKKRTELKEEFMIDSTSSFVIKARTSLGLSQEAFAKKISEDISRSAVAMWETGKRNPSMLVIKAITALLVEDEKNED